MGRLVSVTESYIHFCGAFISCGLMLHVEAAASQVWLMHIMWTLKTPAVNAKIMFPKWWMLAVTSCIGMWSPPGGISPQVKLPTPHRAKEHQPRVAHVVVWGGDY